METSFRDQNCSEDTLLSYKFKIPICHFQFLLVTFFNRWNQGDSFKIAHETTGKNKKERKAYTFTTHVRPLVYFLLQQVR